MEVFLQKKHTYIHTYHIKLIQNLKFLAAFLPLKDVKYKSFHFDHNQIK